jgi:hypothetical protein
MRRRDRGAEQPEPQARLPAAGLFRRQASRERSNGGERDRCEHRVRGSPVAERRVVWNAEPEGDDVEVGRQRERAERNHRPHE